jgi:hypothetical protein
MLSQLYDVSMATGEHARTLTPDTPLIRRKRSHTQTEAPGSTTKKSRGQGQSLVVEAINRSIEARRSEVSKAIEILTAEYYTRLPRADFHQAVDLLSDEIKASVFVSLGVRDIRDGWLERHAQVVFNTTE